MRIGTGLANVLTALGITGFTTCLASGAIKGAAEYIPAIQSGADGLVGLPWWLYAAGAGASVVVWLAGVVAQTLAQGDGFADFARGYEAAGWRRVGTPGWASESRTFPLGRGKRADFSVSLARAVSGYWVVQFLTETAGPGQASGEMTTYHIVGLCFVGEMPRVQIAPRPEARGVYRLAGGRSVRTGDNEFDSKWTLRASDANEAIAIANPFARAKLLERGLRGRPVILDGAGIWTWYPEPMGDDEIADAAKLLLEVARGIPLDVYRTRTSALLRSRTDDIAADWREAFRELKGIPEDDVDSGEGEHLSRA